MQLKEKTLVILTPGFPESEADSTCIPDRQVFVRTLKRNYPFLNVVVLAFQYPFEAKVEKWYGIEVICFNGGNKGRLSRLIIWYKVWKVLTKLARKHDIIGLLSFWIGECSLIGKLFAQQYSLFHYSWILGQDAKKGNWYAKYLRPKGNELIALSDSLVAEFHKNYSVEPEYVIPNGIDPSLFPLKDLLRDIDVLGAGSLIHLKQYDVFLRLVNELKIHFPFINAALAGRGPEEKKLRNLVTELGLSNNIQLTGEKPHQELFQLMQRSRVFLHTSSYEGFSSVCLEALYCGAQVISFCKPMKSDLEHWHVVSDEKEMLQKAIDILRDPAADHSSAIPFLMDKSAKRVMNLYPCDL